MGFLDATGITTLVTKLKERFLLRTELKTVNDESLIGSGNIRGENRTFAWFIVSAIINPTSAKVYMSSPARNDFGTAGSTIYLDSGKKYEIEMGANANGTSESMTVTWTITLSSGSTSSISIIIPANGDAFKKIILENTKQMSGYLTVTKGSTTSRILYDVFCKIHEL